MSTATAPKQLAALLVAHAQLVPSLTNPRKRFDRDRLEELALSMAPPVGILEPLVVRTLSAERAKGLSGPGAFYEIIAGERRWRAAAIAKLEEIPIVIREIADDQVIKLQLVENKNREDIHPLEEAEAMERLLKISKAETPKTIAATIGMSERYVQNRLHYLRLVPEVKEAFRTEAITAGHVDLLMRLPVDEQTRSFKDGLYESLFDYDALEGKQNVTKAIRSVRDLGAWIKDNVRLPLDAQSPQLELLPDVATAVTESKAAGAPTLVELTTDYDWPSTRMKDRPAPLTRRQWAPVSKNQKCDYQVRGVFVIGAHRGEIRTVCTGVGFCKLHFAHTIEKARPKPSAGGAPKSADARADRAKEIAAEKKAKAARDAERERETRRRKLWDHLVDKVAPKAVPANPPAAAVLRLLDWSHGGRGAIKTLRDVALFELGQMGPYAINRPQEYTRVAAMLKPLGIDLPAIEKQLFPPAVAAPSKIAGISKKQAAVVHALHSKKPAKKKAAPKRKAGAKK